jgi:hypothetical protein
MSGEIRHVQRDGVRLVITFLAAPMAWTLHLLSSYFAISFGCASGWSGTRVLLIALTVLCAGASLFSAYAVYRDWPRPIRVVEWTTRGEEQAPVSAFLLGLGLIATGFFTLAILLGGIGSLLLPLCAATHH